MTPEEEKPFDLEKYLQEKKVERMPAIDDPFTALSIRKTLEIAGRFFERGNFQQALGLYRRLIKDFPGTKEASEAKACIAEIAKEFEGEGEHYAALALYRSLRG